jgi:hypothetical protein
MTREERAATLTMKQMAAALHGVVVAVLAAARHARIRAKSTPITRRQRSPRSANTSARTGTRPSGRVGSSLTFLANS